MLLPGFFPAQSLWMGICQAQWGHASSWQCVLSLPAAVTQDRADVGHAVEMETLSEQCLNF